MDLSDDNSDSEFFLIVVGGYEFFLVFEYFQLKLKLDFIFVEVEKNFFFIDFDFLDVR